jgi:transcriptional regulator with XRE-family HTH domain
MPTGGPPAVGQRLQALRKAQRLSLDELSRRAGVSKSMLSDVERNQANPTVAVVWRLAQALGVSLGDLLAEGETVPAPAITVLPAHAAPLIRSPDGLCELRILGPLDLAGRIEWYELTVQPGGELVSEAHEGGTREHLTVLGGSLTVSCGGEVPAGSAVNTPSADRASPGAARTAAGAGTALPGAPAAAESHLLRHGDSARYAADRPHAIRHAGRGVARALLVVELLG